MDALPTINLTAVAGERIRKSALLQARQLQRLVHLLRTSAEYHPETTHEIRKLTRKCTAAWEWLYRSHAVRRKRQLMRYWRSVRHCVGELRDADIRLEEFHNMFPHPGVAEKQLLGNLEQSWLMKYQNALKMLQQVSDREPLLMSSLSDALTSKKLTYNWNKKSQRWLNRQIIQWQELAALSLTHPENLHAFRICTKKLRYRFQYLQRFLPKESTWLNDLETLQEHLGRHRDLLNTLAWLIDLEKFLSIRTTIDKPLRQAMQRWRKQCTKEEGEEHRQIRRSLAAIGKTG